MNTQPSFGEAAVETFGDAADFIWLLFFVVILMPVWLVAGALLLVYGIGYVLVRLVSAAVEGYRSAGTTVS